MDLMSIWCERALDEKLTPWLKSLAGEHGYRMCPCCLQDVLYSREWSADGSVFEEVCDPCLIGGRQIFILSLDAFGMAYYCRYCNEQYYFVYVPYEDKCRYVKQCDVPPYDVLYKEKNKNKKYTDDRIWVSKFVLNYMNNKLSRRLSSESEE